LTSGQDPDVQSDLRPATEGERLSSHNCHFQKSSSPRIRGGLNPCSQSELDLQAQTRIRYRPWTELFVAHLTTIGVLKLSALPPVCRIILGFTRTAQPKENWTDPSPHGSLATLCVNNWGLALEGPKPNARQGNTIV